MKEDKWLLSQNDEDGINKFWDLGQDEKLDPKSDSSISVGLLLGISADSLLHGLSGKSVKQMWDSPNHTNGRKGGKE